MAKQTRKKGQAVDREQFEALELEVIYIRPKIMCTIIIHIVFTIIYCNLAV